MLGRLSQDKSSLPQALEVTSPTEPYKPYDSVCHTPDTMTSAKREISLLRTIGTGIVKLHHFCLELGIINSLK
jgi:hypothetical protein